MILVICDKKAIYFGNDLDAAMLAMDSNSNNCSLHTVNSLEDAKRLLNNKPEKKKVEPDSGFSTAIEKALKQLHDLGLVNECKNLSESLQKNGEKAVGEARSLGIETMKTVGDGFIAFGELLNQKSKDFFKD